MKDQVIFIIFAVFTQFCISTIIIVQQQQPQHRPNGPPSVPVPEIHHYPKQNAGNSSSPSNGTSPQQKSMEPPHSQPPPSQNHMRPQPQFAPMFQQNQQQGPHVQFVPLGQLLFGGPGYGYGYGR